VTSKTKSPATKTTTKKNNSKRGQNYQRYNKKTIKKSDKQPKASQN